MKWLVTVMAVIAFAGFGYYGVRNVNPTRPLIGEPTAANFEVFARRLHGVMVRNGYRIERYAAELKKTSPATDPIEGEFECVMGEGHQVIHFVWKDARWVDRGGGYQALADLAQD